MKINEITEAVIGAAMEVHRTLGPGLLESAYIQCLCYELALRKVAFQLELPLPVQYKGVKLDCGYRLDLVAVDAVVVEVKAVETHHSPTPGPTPHLPAFGRLESRSPHQLQRPRIAWWNRATST